MNQKDQRFMIAQKGFTLIEIVLFIIVTGLMSGALLLAFTTLLRSSPVVLQQTIASQAAEQCMEWFIGQRRLSGYNAISCPSSTVPAFCSVPAGFTLNVSVQCTSLNADANYKTITVTVDGKADTVLTTIVANY